MLDKCVGTIKNYFYNMNKVPIYDKELPETIEVPSMYFPAPTTLPAYHSKDQYRVQYTLDVQLFLNSTHEAVSKAEEIVQPIRANKNQLDIIDLDLSKTGNKIVFETISTSDMQVEGIAQVRLIWNIDYNFEEVK